MCRWSRAHAVDAQQNVAMRPHADGVVDARQRGRIERGDNHAAERAIGKLDPPRDVDGPLARHTPDDRLTDEQLSAAGLAMHPKVFAIA
jgi:hypothetical protein